MCVDRLRWLRYFRLLKTISLGGGEEIGRGRRGGGGGGGGGRVEMFSGGAQIVPLGVEIFRGGGGHFLKLIFLKHIVELHTQTFLKPGG